MGTYRLTEDAKSYLKRIYARGLREYGEEQADIYFNAFFDRFEQLQVGRPVHSGIRDRRPAAFSAPGALQPQPLHQPLHRAAGDLDILAV